MPVETGKIKVDGSISLDVQAPPDANGVARLLREANDANCAVIPLGGGTKLELGRPLDRVNLAISTRRLDSILDHQPANLTVKTEAGITLGALNAALAREGQTLPLDPPFADRATVGGILAANSSGPMRVRFGAARDLLIGLRFALPDGQIIHGGADVVKNVAGYDLPKLFVGSLGTLGIIVEASFKVVPLPPTTATFVASFDRFADACQLGLRVLRSPLLPHGVEVVNSASAASLGLLPHPALVVRFAGLASSVKQQVGQVEKWAREGAAHETHALDQDEELWGRIRDLIYDKRTVCKLGALPAQLAALGESAERIAADHGLAASLLAHSVGILLVGLEGSADPVPVIQELRQAAAALNGYVVIERAAREVRARIDPWGPTGNDFTLMQGLKKQFDPNNILNPGRFVGGI